MAIGCGKWRQQMQLQEVRQQSPSGADLQNMKTMSQAGTTRKWQEQRNTAPLIYGKVPPIRM